MFEARLFFAVTGALGLAMSVPIAIVPLRWAGWLAWRVPSSHHPDERDLTVYFARCLGALGAAYAITALYASTRSEPPLVLLGFATLMGVGLTIAHVAGALEQRQPPLETAEIGVYGALSLWGVSLIARAL